MTQWLLAALLISLAAVYTIWRLMPATWQFRGLQALERWLAAGTAPSWLRRFVARRLAARLSAVGCSSCSSAPTKPEP
jgi:hypothetical protein